MTACPYCGKSNEDGSAWCIGCGSSLLPSHEPAAMAVSSRQPSSKWVPYSLDARFATIVLILTLASQVLCGIPIGVAQALVRIEGRGDKSKGDEALTNITLVVMIASPALSGIVTVASAIGFGRRFLIHAGPLGTGWCRCSPRGLVEGLVLGVALGVVVSLSNELLRAYVPYGHVRYHDLDPTNRLAFAPGLPRTLWVVAGVGFAPWSEELLFRGVLYGGYRKTFGPSCAALMTTGVFIVDHIHDVMNFPPAAGALAAVSALGLWTRSRHGSIWSAVALHTGYNAILSYVTVHFMRL